MPIPQHLGQAAESNPGGAGVWLRSWNLRLSEPHLGVVRVRYTGIRAAQYEFVTFVDDDNRDCAGRGIPA